MSTHALRTTGRFRVSAAAIFLALAIAVSVLTVQALSIWSATTKPMVQPSTVQVDPHQTKDDWNRKDGRSKTIRHPSLRAIQANKT